MDNIRLRPPIRARGMLRPTPHILHKDGHLQATSMMIKVSMRIITSRHQLIQLQRLSIHILSKHRVHILIGLDASFQDMDLILEVQEADDTLWWGFVDDGGGDDLIHQLRVLFWWRDLGSEATDTGAVDVARDEGDTDLAIVGIVLEAGDEPVSFLLVCLGYYCWRRRSR